MFRSESSDNRDAFESSGFVICSPLFRYSAIIPISPLVRSPTEKKRPDTARQLRSWKAYSPFSFALFGMRQGVLLPVVFDKPMNDGCDRHEHDQHQGQRAQLLQDH